MSCVRFERRGAVGIVTLDRPERLNAISMTLITDLTRVLRAAAADAQLSALILQGEGRAFCAGNDLKELDDLTRDPVSVVAYTESIQEITRLLVGCDKIVIAAARGYAVGGGFEWLLNCDLVVAGDDLIAFFPEMALGQFVTGGITYLLPRAIGYQQAMELLVLGERQDAQALQRRGLVNWVVPRDGVLDHALAVATAIAAKSRASVAGLKRVITGGIPAALDAALEQERDETIAALSRDDVRERAQEQFKARD